jgi:hypothetical protein
MAYQWTFDDGTFSTAQNPTKIFPAPGNYSVHLTVTDNSGNTASRTLPIAVASPQNSPTPTPTSTPAPTATASPAATQTPTPGSISISGTVSYCANPVPGPVPNVTLTLTGSATSSALSDGLGNYQFSSLPSGGNYIVTPTKSAVVPGSAGINTVDVIAAQRHFLNIALLPAGCRRAAADVNGDSAIDTVDVIAIQRFFLGLSTGLGNAGKYRFIPVNRTYPGIVSNQTAQDYNTLIFGDVASPFAETLDGL